ncbi:MAG: hypothetical protein LBB76_04110 [Azoarcus sp.]|jgi:hypothetical protein|nr:hypothetical protein [Azoarcus sp.]
MIHIFATAALLWLALTALRLGVIENGLLPDDCGPGGTDGALVCTLTWLLVQSFLEQRLGMTALLFGALAFLTASRACAWLGWLAGVAGMVLYNHDYAVVGGLLGLCVLLRPKTEQPC